MMFGAPFLTDIDPKAAVKGSRDPLGIQTLWARLGRHVVGNITTVSTSVRDFTTLILGHYFAEQLVRDGEADGELAVFLRWEQLAAYARGEINGDWSFRGVERVRRNLQSSSRVRLSIDAESQILSNQKTYGIWGLYTVPGRSSGLIEGEPARLTPDCREMVEDHYLPILNNYGRGGADCLLTLLAKPVSVLDCMKADRSVFETAASVLRKRLVKNEREFYRYHLLQGGPADKTDGGQTILANAIEATLEMAGWELSQSSVRGLAKSCRLQAGLGEKVAEHLERICAAEYLLAPAACLFGLILASEGQTIDQVANGIRRQWEKGLDTIDVAATAALETELRDATGDAQSGKRWVMLARALAGGEFGEAVRLLLEQNRFIMSSRAGSLPWAEVIDRKIRVRFQDESGDLPEASVLKNYWRHSYFINSLQTLAKELKG